MSAPRLCQLWTPFEDDIANGWNVYPRPQFKRNKWLSLCGDWQLSVQGAQGEKALGAIRVPFPPESRISGIQRALAKDERYIYRRSFALPDDFNSGRLLLNFGAADQIARVWVNESFVGEHTGGYLPFSFDITECVKQGENILRVEITDALDTELAYGKQRRKRGGMWYTSISGIWQPVWIESVPNDYVRSLRLTPSLDSITIQTEGGAAQKTVRISAPDGELTRRFDGDSVTIDIPDPVHWSPEQPYLYEFTLTSGEDEISSYFALRTVSVQQVDGQAYICLNGKPYFFHGLLDQGYYSDGIYLPASPSGFEWDIKTMKRLGFNMLRKHIKTEPELFYYYCDKYGMIVFQDMVNSGAYNFFIDTALPTVGLRRGISHRASRRRREQFMSDCRNTIALLYDHPCVCYYTIFNEGWGQFDADEVFRQLKPLDETRVWDAASGWFNEKESDVTSEHIYFRKIKLKARPDRPLVLSEFGGYSCKIDGHSFNLDKNYGYKTCATTEEFTNDLRKLYEEEIVPAIDDGLCAAVLTQVSDVEDETNGLVTYDRCVVKVSDEAMQSVAQKLNEAFRAKTGK
ncbi:MAG: glycoside hydrolase family 2 [Ruminococcaceae bacterium]|nr:glycoside hydrolase family 2 [Oscillospiraceae bacterium]